MLFAQRFWEPMADGRVTVAFRRWKRPAAKRGSRHRVPPGVIEIDAVDVVTEGAITGADARRAGFATRDALIAELGDRGGDLYRVRFHFVGADPRTALRADAALSDEDVTEVRAHLDRYDARSRHGPWTGAVLGLIDEHPGIRAADLAALAGIETKPFKANVRKLKELGLTESLDVGYRLSPRGAVILTRVRRTPGRARS